MKRVIRGLAAIVMAALRGLQILIAFALVVAFAAAALAIPAGVLFFIHHRAGRRVASTAHQAPLGTAPLADNPLLCLA